MTKINDSYSFSQLHYSREKKQEYTTKVNVNKQKEGGHYYNFSKTNKELKHKDTCDTKPDIDCGRVYFYACDPGQDCWVHVMKSTLLGLWIAVNNLFVKCLYTLIKGICSKESQERVRLKKLSPLKAFIAIPILIVLSAISFATFGLATAKINHFIGRVERWSLGVTEEDVEKYTLSTRLNKDPYAAPCMQPYGAVKC